MRQVAIVGLSSSTHDDAPYEDPNWELWGLPWDEDRWPYFDRYFEIHPLELLRKPEARRRSGYEDRLKTLDAPLYMQTTYDDIPNAIRYPIERVVEQLGLDYFNSSISYLMGLAIAEGARKIGIWGVDMADIEPTPGDPSYISEFAYQRPNMEYLIGFARGRGIEVYIPPESPLAKFHGEGIPLGVMYPSYPQRYGYLALH
jgi:hypothetical protein